LGYLYLHIGRGKTGTTLIQYNLSQVRADLLAQGVLYVKAGDHGGQGHQQLAKSFIQNVPEYMIPAQRPDQIRRKTAREIRRSSAHHYILSSENFCLADPYNVSAFFENLNQNFQLRVIFFVRSQDEVAESEYNQVIKVANATCSFRTYIEEKLEGCNYDIVAQNWADCIGPENVFCDVYNGAVDDIWSKFSSIIPEIDSSKLTQPVRPRDAIRNRSMGMKATVLLRKLNALNISNRDRVYEEIRSQLAEDDLPALFFSSAEAKKFRNAFEKSNRAFSKQFLKREVPDLGGRRYSDSERDNIVDQIKQLTKD